MGMIDAIKVLPININLPPIKINAVFSKPAVAIIPFITKLAPLIIPPTPNIFNANNPIAADNIPAFSVNISIPLFVSSLISLNKSINFSPINAANGLIKFSYNLIKAGIITSVIAFCISRNSGLFNNSGNFFKNKNKKPPTTIPLRAVTKGAKKPPTASLPFENPLPITPASPLNLSPRPFRKSAKPLLCSPFSS